MKCSVNYKIEDVFKKFGRIDSKEKSIAVKHYLLGSNIELWQYRLFCKILFNQQLRRSFFYEPMPDCFPTWILKKIFYSSEGGMSSWCKRFITSHPNLNQELAEEMLSDYIKRNSGYTHWEIYDIPKSFREKLKPESHTRLIELLVDNKSSLLRLGFYAHAKRQNSKHLMNILAKQEDLIGHWAKDWIAIIEDVSRD